LIFLYLAGFNSSCEGKKITYILVSFALSKVILKKVSYLDAFSSSLALT